jgi:RHS repeat-associated protein
MKTNLMVLLRASTALLLAVAGLAHAQVPADPYNYSRKSSFTYFGAADGVWAGLLQSETVEPDNAQSCVNTSYQYNGYGNKIGATTSNCAGATGNAVFTTRTSSSVYGTQTVQIGATSVSSVPGIFATTSTNALTQSEGKTYDPRFGAMLTLTGPNGLKTTWTVDDFGRKVKELRADGTSTVFAYCVLSGRNLDTTGNSNTNDPLSCPTPVAAQVPTDAVMFVQTEPHDTKNAKSGPFVRVYSDRLGREVRTVTESFDGSAQATGRSGVAIFKDTVYSQYGPKTLETQPYFPMSSSSITGGSNDMGVSRTDYDVLGRPIAIYVADSHGSQGTMTFGTFVSSQAARQTFDYSGLSTTTTNDKGQTRQEEKNVNGELVRITDGAGAQLVHQRDAFGNLVATKDALQNQMAVVYDIRGRKTQMTDPDTGTWKYDYDALGQLVLQVSPNQSVAGTTTTFAYDKLGRMTSRVEPEYATTWYYDKKQDGISCAKTTPTIGKLCETSTNNNGPNRKFIYDDFGRPLNTRTTVPNGPSFATAVTYDSTSGRVTSQTYPTGVQVKYIYTDSTNTQTHLGFLEQAVLGTAANVRPLPNTQGQTATNKNFAAGTVLWQAQVVNAWGKTEKQTYANGVIAQAVYEGATGRTTNLTAGTAGTTTVLNQSYTWDSLNNLTGRIDSNGDRDISTGVSTGAVSETFINGDGVNRLTSYTVSAPQIPGMSRTVDLQYNALGMLLYKSDVGNYTYPNLGAPHPHWLQSVAGNVNATYGYDANGNVTSASTGKYQNIAYTSFNLPDSQTGIQGPAGTPRYTWQYDENHARIKELHTDSSGTRTTWYLHPDNQGGLSFESETAASGTISNRHYLSVGGTAIGVLVSTGPLPNLTASQTSPTVLTSITVVKMEFWHKDHLGSLITTTDHVGNVTQRYAYDPFGKRRYTNGKYDQFGNIVIDWSSTQNWGTDRGFTGHEGLDDIGLVNMNGRIFDPTLGVFLQGDPMLQDPSNLQNYNRYGYCYNNPLTCTDPSGYMFGIDDVAIGYFISAILTARAVGIIDTRTMRMGLSIVVAAYLGPGGGGASWFGGGYASAAAAGFISGAIATGNVKGALQGAFTAGMFYGAGNVVGGGNFFTGDGMSEATKWGLPAGIALHAVVGCVTSAASAGKCGPGALSAAFSKAMTPYTSKLDPEEGVFVSAVVGGTASVLGGGKFANGAVTAAFSYIFNCLSHPGACKKEDQPEIREAMAKCNPLNSACVRPLAVMWRESGAQGAPAADLGAVIVRGLEWTTLPARWVNPLGQGIDLGYTAISAVHDFASGNIEEGAARTGGAVYGKAFELSFEHAAGHTIAGRIGAVTGWIFEKIATPDHN